ncbi:hypothetical protein DQ04_07271030 [Trypanosoma grayi]|uniref:hypothetical protein n=1 Tax=Trypanosoma grayi TaxID=71804 RepID=UPI0004F40128|nr:hypothetical protein DQ04_07271030 [Trypanosoma grayi]KEG08403.1 hypothetical protein DQ04_07271030 [Trypanosoma grayi]
MDPSKRICIKNLPPQCTKREIAEFVRNRTGAQPHSIDLGLDSDGNVRRYAHFSVEGAKNVVPALTGAIWRDEVVVALHAKPHYTYRLAEAKRRREREEAEEQAQLEAFWQKHTERWRAKTGGELQKKKPPKSFYATRQRYSEVAAAIAKRLREEYYNKNPAGHHRRHVERCQQQPHRQQRGEEGGEEARTAGDTADDAYPQRAAGGAKDNQHYKHPRGKGVIPARDVKRRKTEGPVAQPKKQEQQQEPQQPAGPSKEERKLSVLQAKLAALRAKMK